MNTTTFGRSRTKTMRTLQMSTIRQRSVRDRARSALSTITALGWTVIVLTLVSWFVAARLGWEEVAVIATGLLLLVVVCALFAVGRLDLESEISVVASRVQVGDKHVDGRLNLTNRRKRSVRGVRLELPLGDRIVVFPLVRLDGEATSSHDFEIPTDKRAVLPVGPVTTVQGDPLGLFRRTRSWSDVEDVYVHPRTVRLPALTAGLVRDMEGHPTPELSPSDIAFHALRDYVPGDDRRHIHWRSSARLGTLMVRQYVDTRRSHVAVAISADLAEYTDVDEFELAISVGASAARQALTDGQTVSVIVGNISVPTTDPGSMLDHFSAIEPQGSIGNLAESIVALKSRASGASIAVACVGDSIDLLGLRRATSWLDDEVATLVLQAAAGTEPGYQLLDATTLVRVPDLQRLAAGMQAVAS